jgi:ribonucleoside-diphosphate reductase alpha chain
MKRDDLSDLQDGVPREVDPDRRLVLRSIAAPILGSLRWPGRPHFPAGNPAWTYIVECDEPFAVFVGHTESARPHAFEVWVNGAEQPRGLGAVAKTLSADMRTQDRAWVAKKLAALAKTRDDKHIALTLGGEAVSVTSASAALARVVQYRLRQLGVDTPAADEATPVMDQLMSPREPRVDADGTLSWTVDVANAATGDNAVLFLKEAQLEDGARRPYSVWLAGTYPRELDGLCKLLSIDMRVIDPAWIGLKLRKLLSYAEPMGHFFAQVPGTRQSQNWPSTVAYIARLMIHRYAMLNILDSEGAAIREMGVMVPA